MGLGLVWMQVKQLLERDSLSNWIGWHVKQSGEKCHDMERAHTPYHILPSSN